MLAILVGREKRTPCWSNCKKMGQHSSKLLIKEQDKNKLVSTEAEKQKEAWTLVNPRISQQLKYERNKVLSLEHPSPWHPGGILLLLLNHPTDYHSLPVITPADGDSAV